ncbi:MAG: ATP-binding protein, partial [Chloroflexota bacterium]
MARRMTSPVLVGRAESLEQLEAAFSLARTGEPRHIVVGGEAGVGKTRLLSRAQELAEQQGMRVVSGACVA